MCLDRGMWGYTSATRRPPARMLPAVRACGHHDALTIEDVADAYGNRRRYARRMSHSSSASWIRSAGVRWEKSKIGELIPEMCAALVFGKPNLVRLTDVH